MANWVVIGIVSALHDLFTAMWIGGMLALLLAVLPAVRITIEKEQERKKLLENIKKKLSITTYVSIIGLAITGLLLGKASSNFEGLMSFSTNYGTMLSIKHIIVIFMVIIALFRSIFIKKIAFKNKKVAEKLNFILLVVNIVFGITILILSGLIARMPGS
ncbi:MAG: hypothetical protein ACTSVB_08855 [Candidatus Heimdallarchaeaceae archaeon]|uniref:Copper resistance protein D domain-containing protein n=1 Tax=Candidatus Heimdallarchaeum endolithica TaxID=2876572 RepID=A0A9Y1BT55_9ARCH|nr:MAG: hypothetical protein K9W46_04840 [Candidatus Heimdallarchaeum endolithica]